MNLAKCVRVTNSATFLMTASVVTVAVALSGCGTETKTVTEEVVSAAPPTEEPVPAPVPEPEVPVEEEAPPGPTVPRAAALTFPGEWRIRLNKVRRADKLSGFLTDENLRVPKGQYVIANLTLTNLRKSPVDSLLYSNMFELEDVDGTTYAASDSATIEAFESEDRWDPDLQPKQPTRGSVVFDVPTSARLAYIRLWPTPESLDYNYFEPVQAGRIALR